jgi:hypothetical protein
MNEINSLIYKSFTLYLMNKSYCEKCKEITPHIQNIKGNIIIEKCLICNDEIHIDIKKLFKLCNKSTY